VTVSSVEVPATAESVDVDCITSTSSLDAGAIWA